MVDKQIKQYVLAVVSLLLIFIIYLVANYTIMTPQFIFSIITIGFILLYQPCAIVLDKKMRSNAFIFIAMAMIAMLFIRYRAISFAIDLIIISLWMLIVIKNNRGKNKHMQNKELTQNSEELIKINNQKQLFKNKLSLFLDIINNAKNSEFYNGSELEQIEDLLKLTGNHLCYRNTFECIGVFGSDKPMYNFNFKLDITETVASLKDKYLIACPWDIAKINNFAYINDEKLENVLSYESYYCYKHLNICTISGGGNHRAYKEMLRNIDSKTRIHEIDDAVIFEYGLTDGRIIYNKTTNENYGELYQYEFSVFYVLTQLKYYYLNKSKEEYLELLNYYKKITDDNGAGQ